MMMIALSLLPEQGCFFREPTSVDSWTPGPKPLCHRHPTGPHPSGLLWTPAERESTKTDVALARELAVDEVEPVLAPEALAVDDEERCAEHALFDRMLGVGLTLGRHLR